jgi:hypothetical protein
MKKTWMLLLLIGCDASAPNLPTETPPPTVPDHWTTVTPDGRVPATIDPVAAPVEGKIARRLSVDQLRQSIPALFDGITWTTRGREQNVMFDALSKTLGEPDYLGITAENLDASPLFAKFMDDMAGDVCTKAVARDESRPVGDRVLIIDDTDVAKSLRVLRLKLHGLYVPEGSSEGLEDYLVLHQSVATTEGASEAWKTVCVAMLTAPELMIY